MQEWARFVFAPAMSLSLPIPTASHAGAARGSHRLLVVSALVLAVHGLMLGPIPWPSRPSPPDVRRQDTPGEPALQWVMVKPAATAPVVVRPAAAAVAPSATPVVRRPAEAAAYQPGRESASGGVSAPAITQAAPAGAVLSEGQAGASRTARVRGAFGDYCLRIKDASLKVDPFRAELAAASNCPP